MPCTSSSPDTPDCPTSLYHLRDRDRDLAGQHALCRRLGHWVKVQDSCFNTEHGTQVAHWRCRVCGQSGASAAGEVEWVLDRQALVVTALVLGAVTALVVGAIYLAGATP